MHTAGRRSGVWFLTAAGLVPGGPAWAQPDAHLATEPVTRYDGHRVVRVEVRTARDLRTVLALTDDVWTESVRQGGPIDVRVTPEQFAAVAATGLRCTVMIENVQAEIDREVAEVRAWRAGDDPAWYTSYHNYADIKAYCQTLAAAHPGIATYFVLGNSLQGREIFGLRITGPGSTANRPAGVWWSNQHAREWITPPVNIYCAEQLLTRYASDPHIRHLVDNVEFVIVPTVNPDGYEWTWTNTRLWRKNRRPNTGTGCTGTIGVDLNRNWGFQWGLIVGQTSASCSSDVYIGSGPFSEPETQVMRDFVSANPRVRITMDWHSYGQLVMYPWSYTATPVSPPAVAAQYGSTAQSMAAAIFGVHGMVYDPGPLNTTLYPASGVSVDWAHGARGAMAFTIELRDNGQTGFLLPAAQITPTCEENWGAFLVMAESIVPCYPNCDGSTETPALNVGDFTCFLTRYAAGDPVANCDGSTELPDLNVADFTCFLSKYAAGCP